MSAMLLVLLVGLAGGVAVGFQSPLASMIRLRIGTLESIFIIHIGGAVASILLLLLCRGGHLAEWRTVPWYGLGAGLLGVVVIGAITYTIPRIGAAPAVVILLAGQLAVGLILDHMGFLGLDPRPITLTRAAGLAVVFAGVWLAMR